MSMKKLFSEPLFFIAFILLAIAGCALQVWYFSIPADAAGLLSAAEKSIRSAADTEFFSGGKSHYLICFLHIHSKRFFSINMFPCVKSSNGYFCVSLRNGQIEYDINFRIIKKFLN